MAYNILKGKVEFTGDNGYLEKTVDDYSDQAIGGKKNFTQRITASAITLNGEDLPAPVITSVTNAAAQRVAMFNGAAGLSGSSVFTYGAGGILNATIYSGSGAGLTNLRTDQFQGYISASNLVLGTGGLKSVGGVLTVSGGAGVTVTAGGATIVNRDAFGGLNFNAGALILDTGQTYDIANNGQSLASGDKLFVQDVAGANPAAPQLRSMTVGTLTTYLNSNLSFPTVGISTLSNAGVNRVITSDGGSQASAEANLTFNGTTLTVAGNVTMNGAGLILSGGVVRAASGAVVADSRLAVGKPHNPAYDISVDSTGSGNIYVNGAGGSGGNYLLGLGGVQYGRFGMLGSGDVVLENNQAGGDVLLDVNGVSDAFRIKGTGAEGPAITASLNMVVTGASPRFSVGTAGDANSGMLFVRAKPSNDVVLMMASNTDNEPLFAVTGSGQVIVGGNYLQGQFNVTGSDNQKLIIAKSNAANPAFHVSGSGDVFAHGSIRGKQLFYTTHKFNPGGDQRVYLRFDINGSENSPDSDNKMVAPHSGKLIKIVWRFEGAGTGANTTTAFNLHKGTTGQQQIQTTPVATVNLTDTFVNDTTYTATFDATATYNVGDIVGVSIDPGFSPGITNAVCVWEYDQNT